MARLKYWLTAGLALAFVLWAFLRGPGKMSDRAENVRQRLTKALMDKAEADRQRQEAQADAELKEKRRASSADRLADALRRARRRRDADPGAG